MYFKSEIKSHSPFKDNHHKIGMDAARFKFINYQERGKNFIHVKGTISHVGRDFVDLTQENQSIITVPIERVVKINWLDQKCDRFCAIKNDDNCRCVKFNLFKEFNHRNCDCVVREQFHHQNDDFHNKQSCKKCNRINKCTFCVNKDNDCPHCNHNHHEERKNHQNEHKYCPHSQNNHRHNCNQRFTCFSDFPIPFCDNRIQLRLAGLNDGVHFELMQNKGCKVILELSSTMPT